MGILGIDDDEAGHEPHPLFSEMGELFCDANGEMEWHETARSVSSPGFLFLTPAAEKN